MASSFLQSPEWEEIQKKIGRKTWRIQDTLVIEHKLPGGLNYLYSPRPYILPDKEILFFSEVKKLALSEGSIFLKIDPVREFTKKYSAQKNSSSLQPRETVISDLTKTTEDILKNMHEKTRYNIRLAERKGVSVIHQENEGEEAFWKLLQETAKRDRFHTHEQGYYETLLAVRSDHFSNELFFAKYDGEVIAGALINFYEKDGVKMATYLHGASSNAHRSVMAPQLLHWKIMEGAKRRGCAGYDFWGIDEKKWPGVTRFKKGFGAERVAYPESFDIIYRRIYYFLYQFFRRIVRM